MTHEQQVGGALGLAILSTLAADRLRRSDVQQVDVEEPLEAAA